MDRILAVSADVVSRIPHSRETSSNHASNLDLGSGGAMIVIPVEITTTGSLRVKVEDFLSESWIWLGRYLCIRQQIVSFKLYRITVVNIKYIMLQNMF